MRRELITHLWSFAAAPKNPYVASGENGGASLSQVPLLKVGREHCPAASMLKTFLAASTTLTLAPAGKSDPLASQIASSKHTRPSPATIG